MIEFWGTLGKGRRQRRGLPEASDSEILTKDSALPAPPEGGAANILRAPPLAAGTYSVVADWLAC